MTSVALREVSVQLGGAPVLAGIDAAAMPSTWTALVGPNGAGKTTILRTIAALVPYTGDVLVDGRPVLDLPRRLIAQTIAYVPQRPVIPPAMTVFDYVLMGRTAYIPYFGTEGTGDLAATAEALALLELEELSQRALGTLSGGELQRAILARAIAQGAPVLLLDEPTSALDIGHAQSVLETIDRLRRDRNLTVVSAMHDLNLAAQFADHVVVIDGGRVAAAGSPSDVLTAATVRTHFGAHVVVVEADDGSVLILPRRGLPATTDHGRR